MTPRRSRSKPWCTKEVRILARKRATAYAAYKKSPSSHLRKRLELITKHMKSILKTEKNKFFGSFEIRIQRSPKKLRQLAKLDGKDTVSIPPLELDGNLLHSDIEKATHLNQYFSSVFAGRSSGSAISAQTSANGEQMEDVVFDQRGIQKLLEKLCPSKAWKIHFGPDGLQPALLSMCARSVSKYLFVIFSKSLGECILPDDWKLAYVVPVHKSGPRSIASNYRPISLTCISCKILEHILFTNIMNQLKNYSLLSPQQHGFKPGFSCVTQLTGFTHDLASALDNGFTADCLYLDFRKAFDLVSHALLIQKLSWYNINPYYVI